MEALVYSFLAGISTAIGAIIVAFFGQPSQRALSGLLGFAGGIMLAISAFDLMPESLEIGSMSSTIIGFSFGAIMMYALDKFIPHAHMSGGEDIIEENTSPLNNKEILRTGYLIFFGIALHNLPEGLAIGAGLESSPELGLYIAIAIGLHNIPEGMATAGPLRAGGLRWIKVFLLTLFAGLMTPLGAALGLIIFNISPVLVAGGLAFAAGAMVYIVSDELIPQSHNLHSHIANAGLIIGLLLGFVLTS
ncbi:ZIP family metal transporter [Natranaerobius thermophilus]|uniref:Zinc/iron permease n=1 Tax=Natranaerobius thermophilus (strain ATCC BAA-1301 / DSM 18059 / JW/NM-WN-LF) TaxID=457570 RepID=B2A323_NATTJ|nr:ZIP family metal transporter [Natranaerobius thermophilus]ACB83635.1 zinc/iron permease [Natranaerobius thermophilus JW/NM-WN-LF]